MHTEQGVLPPEMVIAQVCDKMHWTLQEYDEQPMWFIDALLLKWQEETAYQKTQSKVE